MVTRDFVGGAAAVALGAAYLAYAYQIRASALADTLGPGGMPRAYGWLLVVLGGILCAQAAIAGRRAAPLADEWRGQRRRILWAAGLLAFGVAYVLVVERLGYLVSIALLLMGVALYQGAAPGWRPLLIAVVGATLLWTLFAVILGVRLPQGPLAWIAA